MAQKKLKRFAAIKAFHHVFEYPENMAGQWHAFFQNDQPIVLELACGKGEYTTGLAAMHPEKNYIGVDVKGNRMYVGAKKALDQRLRNVAFLRCQIDMISAYFSPGEVSEIWLTFPDPQLRTGKNKKRLTHPKFLRKYETILQPEGVLHLKTDSPLLYNFTLGVLKHYNGKVLKQYDDVYAQATEPQLLDIKTHYETLDIAQSGKIHYLKFHLPRNLDAKLNEEFTQWVKEVEIGREP